jgi:multidrug transporter EmrE-like cation transporter
MLEWTPYAFIAGIVLIEALGDYYLAEFAINGLASGVVIGYLSYAIVLVLFVSSIRTMGLAWSNSAWDGWSNIATNLVAVYGLGETPSTTQYIGMVFISIGLLLLGNKGTAKRLKL